MPCYKFISIRLEKAVPTYVYVDNMTTPKHALNGSLRFKIEAPLVAGQTNQGSVVKIDPMRWPPGQSYDAPLALYLSAQWPFGTTLCLPADAVGHSTGRSVDGVDFTYDATANPATLSWNQIYQGAKLNLKGSLDLNVSPVWYVTLVLDTTPHAVGRMIVNGVDIS